MGSGNLDDEAPDGSTAVDQGTVLLALYRDAVGEVFRYHHARCGNRALAEDLTADTFLAAVGQIRRTAVDEVTIAWLIGIARHKLVDHWRRLERRPRTTGLPSNDVAAEALGHSPGSDDMWDAVISRAQVDTVMAQLGEHHRSALMLRYFDGLPVPDVAEHLGRTIQATETLLVRARRRFKTIYERTDEAGGRP